MSDIKSKKKTPEQETKGINADVSKTGLVATREGINDRMNKLRNRSSTALQTSKTTTPLETSPALPPKATETMQLITNSLPASPLKSAPTPKSTEEAQKGSPTKKSNFISLLEEPNEEEKKDDEVQVKTSGKSSDTPAKKQKKEEEEEKVTKGAAVKKISTQSLFDMEAEGDDEDGEEGEADGSDASDVDKNGNIIGLIQEEEEEEEDSDAMDVSDSFDTKKKKAKERERKEQKRLAKLRAEEREKEYELDKLIASKLEAGGGRSKTAAIGIKSMVGSKTGGLKKALKSIHGKVVNLNKLERKELAKMEASEDEEDEEEEEEEENESGEDSKDGDDAKSSRSDDDEEEEEGEDKSVDLMDVSNEEVATPAPEKAKGKGKGKSNEKEPEDPREAEDLKSIKQSLGEDQSSVKSEAPPASSSLLTFDANDFDSNDGSTASPTAATTNNSDGKADNAAEEDDDDNEFSEGVMAPIGGSHTSPNKATKLPDRQVITVDHEVLCRETAADVYSIMSKDPLMRKHFGDATMSELNAYIKGLDVVVRSGPIAPGSSSKVAEQVNPQIDRFAEEMRMKLGALLTRIFEVTKNVNEPWAARLNIVVLITAGAGKVDIVENLKAKRDITCAFSGTTIHKDSLFGMLLVNAPSLGGLFSFPFAPSIPSTMNWMRPQPKSSKTAATATTTNVIDLVSAPVPKPVLPPVKEPATVYQNQEEDPDIAKMMLEDNIPTPAPAPATATTKPTVEIEADEEDPMELEAPEAKSPAAVDDQKKTIWELLLSGKLRLHVRYTERLLLWVKEIRKLVAKGDQSVASRIDPNDTSAVAVSAPYFKGNGLPSVIGSYDATKPNHPWIKESLRNLMQTFFMVYDPQDDKKKIAPAARFGTKGLLFDIHVRPNELDMATEIFNGSDTAILMAIAEFVYQDGLLKDLETFQAGVATLRTTPIGRAVVDNVSLKALDSIEFFPSEKPGLVHVTRLRFYYRLLANLFGIKIVYFINPKK